MLNKNEVDGYSEFTKRCFLGKQLKIKALGLKMNRDPFKSVFYKDSIPDWYCPTCGKRLLKLLEDTLLFKETLESRVKRDRREDWYPDEEQYVYTCMFECSNERCKQIVASSGRGGVQEIPHQTREGKVQVEFIDYFEPKVFIPPLKIIDIPYDTPKSVRNELQYSFGLYFVDPGASANHARASLELLLNELKIKRFRIRQHKRIRLSLHERIGLLPIKYDSIKPLFYAIKWLGNAGSHGGSVMSKNDVLNLYEILSELLHSVYDNKQKGSKIWPGRLTNEKDQYLKPNKRL